MSNLKIVGPALPDMPWEERPVGSKEIMWRYSANPIIGRDALSTSNSIFNSAVIPFKKGEYNYAGVFRCDDTNPDECMLRVTAKAKSEAEAEEMLRGAIEEVMPVIGEWVYGYDPRVTKIGDRYYVTWCNGYHGPTIGVAWTEDFETFRQLENAFLPYNRNGVLFPRKIRGNFAMLSRPSDTGHTPFGDIFYSESPDMEFWGRHRHVMSPAAFEVSALGFGVMGMTYNRSQHPDKKQCIRLLHEAVERGVTLFDTAIIYGPLTNENLAGEALSEFKGRINVTTKFGHEVIDGKGTGRQDSRPATIRRYCEESLHRLRLRRTCAHSTSTSAPGSGKNWRIP